MQINSIRRYLTNLMDFPYQEQENRHFIGNSKGNTKEFVSIYCEAKIAEWNDYMEDVSD